MALSFILFQAALAEEVQLQQLVENTRFDFFRDGFGLIAVVGLFVGIFSAIYTWRVNQGVQRIDKACQERLLFDIIRHLYRNTVCTLAMRAKYNEEKDANGMGTVYPSEEHLFKLKLLPSDIHLEQYYKDATRFRELHEIELQFRNYNTEIDIAVQHISTEGFDEDTKSRDFETLIFKPSFLIDNILGAMAVLDANRKAKKLYKREAEKIIRECQIKNAEKNKLEFRKEPGFEKFLEVKDGEGKIMNSLPKEIERFFKKSFGEDVDLTEFQANMLQDFLIECGRNDRGQEKIHMIKF